MKLLVSISCLLYWLEIYLQKDANFVSWPVREIISVVVEALEDLVKYWQAPKIIHEKGNNIKINKTGIGTKPKKKQNFEKIK